MKICLYTFQFPNYLGGVSTYTYELYNLLVKKGHEVHVVTRKHPNNLKVNRLHESSMIPIPIAHYITNSISSYDIIKKIKPDIIHAQNGGPGLLVQKSKFPQITTVHALSQLYKTQYSLASQQGILLNIGFLVLKNIEIMNFSNSQRIIALSKHGKHDLIRHYNVPQRKISIIPNGVDIEKYNPSKKSTDLIEKFGKIIFFTGTHDERKGILELMKIIKRFNRIYQKKDVSFLISGKGPLFNAITNFSRRYDNVHVLGYLSTNELIELYASAYIFLFPTRMESFPFTLLEALSSGCPILSTPVCGIPELFNHELDIGAMIPNQDVARYTDTLVNLLDDESEVEVLGRNSRKLVEKFYNWEVISQDILTEYQNVINERK